MTRVAPILATLLALTVLPTRVGTHADRQSRTSTSALALAGGTIYTNPTDEPIRNGVVLIGDGKIAAVVTVMRGDPVSDVRALAAVQYTLREGTIIYRRR